MAAPAQEELAVEVIQMERLAVLTGRQIQAEGEADHAEPEVLPDGQRQATAAPELLSSAGGIRIYFVL